MSKIKKTNGKSNIPMEGTDDSSSNSSKSPFKKLTDYFEFILELDRSQPFYQFENRNIIAKPTKHLLPEMSGRTIIIEFIEDDKKISIEDQRKMNNKLSELFNTDDNNIIRFFGVSDKVPSHLIVMQEYMEKGGLEQYLIKRNRNGNPHKVQQLIHFCTQIANGMKYLHSHNIKHGRIAARSILVEKRENLNVKIYDFSMHMVLFKNNNKYPDNIKSTELIRWWATECFKDFKATPKTEVWAFGITMWEIFTHCVNIPYHVMSIEKLNEDVKKNGKRELPECPNFTDKVILKLMKSCWNHKPSKRPDIGTLYKKLRQLCLN